MKTSSQNLLSINAGDQGCLAVAGWETHRDGMEKGKYGKELERWQRLRRIWRMSEYINSVRTYIIIKRCSDIYGYSI